jgi:hypothetical protein
MSFFVFLVLGPQILLEPISIAYEVCVCVCVCAYPPGVVQVARVAEDSAEAPRKSSNEFEVGCVKGGSGCSQMLQTPFIEGFHVIFGVPPTWAPDFVRACIYRL